METIKFLVQGSANEPYVVVFRKIENNFSALCSCPACENGMYCKHRFRIMEGSTENIISNNKSDVEIVKSWLIGSDVESAIKELKEVENELLRAKKKVSDFKKKLSRKLID
ncbi:MAG: hypothetical protein WC209_00865 [Ignavibacteriaceae bacterium]|jgi:hypothetical protein